MKIAFRCHPSIVDVLPRPVAAKTGLPDWIKTMPQTAFSDETGGSLQTVRQCLPFVDAMMAGYLMPLAADLHVEDGRIRWDDEALANLPASEPRSPLGWHPLAQVTGTPFGDQGRPVVKFMNFWSIETEPGWWLFVTHPVNRPTTPFHTLSGYVATDRFKDVPINFPALWVDPGFRGVIPRGTPIAQCIPVKRETDEVTIEAFEGDALERSGALSRDFRGKQTKTRQHLYRKNFRKT
jgi:hypothetical protein